MSVVATLSTLAVVGHAQPSSQDRALAESIFREAKALAKAKDLDAACPKFAESQRLDPQLGTLLHLATCHEQQGKTASAWAEFSEAADLAAQRGDKREKIAQQRAEALEPGLSRLTLERASDARPATVVVRLDNREIGAAMLSTAMPIDPGQHEITVSAPGHIQWSRTIEVDGGGARLTITIGDLEANPAADPPDAPAPPDAPTPPPSTSSSLATAGWVTFAFGTASLLVGSGLGIAAMLERDAADEDCDGRFCGEQGLAGHDTARDLATASTVTFIVGLVGMAAGITLVVAAPSEPSSARLSLLPGGLAIEGTW